ncbi:TetR/AcrR family transcriptional regulator [Streptomyces alkaliterrae]|uniref:TetR family transcriptional regulator n=1 Tax=Streptomyces alkaliterrae TaxID=2213162 RepID=A0A5P0YK91_9ACTN|nr:TetR/AcrR family transcriptional regulator [Streptomyces alkaliterrae]MBB1251953.1 TetR family transcriptional regulator [Streptomyces alkaliterrae]MBB1257360.1 TetR family transcriptional regulator [Streptomyces alkaliterrae]MQS00745.1 TetR family transcriptional regulator [Streptomyces alkaliterrae]
MSAAPTPLPPRGQARAELISDTAIRLLAERGMRGLTHRAVDEAAGLPPGSTSNHARTREALLEAAVRRLLVRERRVLDPEGMPVPGAGVAGLADAVAGALSGYLSDHRELLVARYELALEATRRPALRACYDEVGEVGFQRPLSALLAAAGSPDPERHAHSLTAWCDGVLFGSTAGSYSRRRPTREQLRAGLTELLGAMLPAGRTGGASGG